MLNIYSPKLENLNIGVQKAEKSIFIWNKVDKFSSFKEFVIPAIKPLVFKAYKNNGEDQESCLLNIKKMKENEDYQMAPVVTRKCA